MEEALRELRSFVYRMVLPAHEHVVVEHGRTQFEDFSSSEVGARHRQLQLLTWIIEDRLGLLKLLQSIISSQVFASNQLRLPKADVIDRSRIFQNLRQFNAIMQHYDTGTCTLHRTHLPRSCKLSILYAPSVSGSPITNFFDKYGRRNGFHVLTLRYMFWLNLDRNLNLLLDEFVALAACVFCRVDEPWYTGLAIVPSVRCITVASWFQVSALYESTLHVHSDQTLKVNLLI